MLTPAANIHGHRLPSLGAVVSVRTRALAPGRRYRRFIVESFPLFDGADMRYTRGIHTVNLRALDHGEIIRVAGHWCRQEEN